MITNKEMFNINSVRATSESVGDWDGQEQLAADNFNKIQDALYDAAPDEYNDDQISELMKSAWNYWGSEEGLLTITDEHISKYVKETIEE